MTFKLLGGSVLIVALGLTGAKAAQGAEATIAPLPGFGVPGAVSAFGTQEPGLTFTVPLKITGIRPEIKGGNVYCKVGAEGMGGDAQINSGPKEIRHAFAPFTLDASGSFSGHVVVHVSDSSARSYSPLPLSEATRYTCFFRFTDSSSDARKEAKPGTPIVQAISGTIPR